MILSESAATYVRQTGRALFDLDDRAPVVAYIDGSGRVLCPAHRDHARGDIIAQDADNSAMDDARCDSCAFPIAAVTLAAYTAQHHAECHPCRLAYLNRGGMPARPCPAHVTYRGEILSAVVDGSPMPPVPSWLAAPAPAPVAQVDAAALWDAYQRARADAEHADGPAPTRADTRARAETFRGRRLVTKRGREWGTIVQTLNGEPVGGESNGWNAAQLDRAAAGLRRTVIAADERRITDPDAYPAHWYRGAPEPHPDVVAYVRHAQAREEDDRVALAEPAPVVSDDDRAYVATLTADEIRDHRESLAYARDALATARAALAAQLARSGPDEGSWIGDTVHAVTTLRQAVDAAAASVANHAAVCAALDESPTPAPAPAPFVSGWANHDR